MAIAYVLSIIMALFASALPAQILGILWEQICEGMDIGIPYIALMRLLGAVGAIMAVILSDKIKGLILARDIIVGALALEAMALIGFSMSREFWNLALWITALGFSTGLCLSLICYLLRELSAKRAGAMFASSALGIAAGAAISAAGMSAGHSWRSTCQIIAILQIVLCMTIFFLRRTLLKGVVSILRTQRREAQILRERRRRKLIEENGDVDERSEGAYLLRLLFLYGGALLCGLLLLSAIHLTFTAQTMSGDENADITQSIVIVCAAMAAGRILLFILKRYGRHALRIGAITSTVCLGGCAMMTWAGAGSMAVMLIARIGTGLGAGMIFPNLIQAEDERFDMDAQTAMAGLIPAFYVGAEALITPFVQSLSGASLTGICMITMFALSCCMTVFLAFGSMNIKRR